MESPNAKALLSAQARDNAKAGQDFISPSVSFLKSYILMLKAGPKGPDEAQTLIHGTLTFARRTQEDHVDSPQLVDGFFRIASPWFGRLDERSFFRNHESMLTLATQCGLVGYLWWKLSTNNVTAGQGSFLMTYALVPDRGGEGEKIH